MERALVQARLGKYNVSMQRFEQALTLQRQVLGDRHVVIAQTLCQRASIRSSHFDDWEQASVDMTQAVRMVEDLMMMVPKGDDNHTTTTTHTNNKNNHHHHQELQMFLSKLLVQCGMMQLRRVGHYAEGMMYLEKALALQRQQQRQVGINDASRHDEDAISVMADLLCVIAGVYHQQQNYLAASFKYKEALALYKAAKLSNHDERVVQAKRQATRTNLLGHGFWSRSSSSGSCHHPRNKRQSAFV